MKALLLFKTWLPSGSALLLAFLALVLVPGALRAADENLITNGDFERGNDWPDGWGKPKAGGSLEKDKGNHYVRLQGNPDQEVTLYLAIKVQAGKAYELAYRVNVDKLVPGKEGWFDARIITNLKDDSGESFPGPKPVFFRKDSGKWVEKSVKFVVPEGATKLEVIAGLFKVASGTFEIDDFVLKEIDPKSVK